MSKYGCPRKFYVDLTKAFDTVSRVGPWRIMSKYGCPRKFYVDLTKAFDTVSREGLWTIMSKYGCPRKFVAMVKQFDDDMPARVQDNDETSEPFPVTNGVKQGRALAPSLFSIMFSAMLTDAFRDDDIGIGIRYQTDGKLFNLRRLQANTMVMNNITRDFLFADECALNAGSEADMQRSVDKFSDACNDVGLTISIKKTEVLHLPAPGKPYIDPSIKANGQRLNVVNRFTYLGCPKTLSSTTKVTPGSRKPAQPLADYTPMSGTEEALDY